MADQQEHRFLQQVMCNGGNLDLSMLISCVYIEKLDLSGPQLIIAINDRESVITDELGMKEKDILTVYLADAEDRESLDIKTEFVVQSMPKTGDVLTINCFHHEIEKLKTRAVEAQLFSGVPVDSILKQLAPGLDYDIDSVPVIEDYHLLPGQRPSKLIRKMARENAAVCFICRETLYFKKISGLLTPGPAYTYEYNNIEAGFHIADYNVRNHNSVLNDGIKRKYSAFDENKGLLECGNAGDLPVEMTSTNHIPTLNNLNVFASISLDLIMEGNGGLWPGETLKIVWNLFKEDAPVDESLPDKIAIKTVSHMAYGTSYKCKVECLISGDT